MALTVIPISIREAQEFVDLYHRHNKRPQGAKFAIGAEEDGRLVGVAICGNPVSATLMDGFTLEVTRVCVLDDAPKNTCSFLYGRCWRIWQQMGGKIYADTQTTLGHVGNLPFVGKLSDRLKN